MKESTEVKNKYLKEFEGLNLQDPVIKEEFEGDFNFLCNLDQRIMELSGELFKFDIGAKGLHFMKTEIGDYFEKLSENPKGIYEKLYPICYFTDVVEYGPED